MNIDEALKIFELSHNATEKDIKTKYRILVLKYHPDRNKDPDAESKFIKINQAYKTILEDKNKTPIPQQVFYYQPNSTSFTFTINSSGSTFYY